MKVFLFLFLMLLGNNLLAQNFKNEVLFTVNKESVTVSEFQRIYEKNIHLVTEEAKDIDKNLNMYIDYKLKVNEAYNLKLDTVTRYKKELLKYEKQLIAPYLIDRNFEKQQLDKAYNRIKEEVRARHILIRFSKGSEIDTLTIKKKLNTIKERIALGESFQKLAKEFSEDPSAKNNGGDLGYFSAFKMVTAFEDVAYKTPKGKVSEPFRTRFGYHILKVTDKRPAQGQFKVAHILIQNSNPLAKTIINKVYNKLETGASFKTLAEKYTEDLGTKKQGGVLPKFGSNTMVVPFEKAVWALKEEGSYSKPFQTKYGWHIVKLLKRYPIKSFKEEKPDLLKKINKNYRRDLPEKEVVKKLLKKYTVVESKDNLISLINENVSKDNLTLFTIEKTAYKIKDFKVFSNEKGKSINETLYKTYFISELLNYFKKDLELTNEDFKFTLKEYREGLLLFDLLQTEIWKKVSNDSYGLREYYNLNKHKYNKSFELEKRKVMNDYQNHLEDMFIKDLRLKNTIAIKKRTLRKFKLKNNKQ